MRKTKTEQSLLLDRNYMALSLVSWKKAIKLMINGKAEPVYDSSNVKSVGTKSGVFDVPSIVRLLSPIPWRAHSDKVRFSRKSVLVRDNYTCQYCGIKISICSLTIDHVLPRSRGGKTEYTNCVASCKVCNNLKADSTLDEAGMRLLKQPKKPTFISLWKNRFTNVPKEWECYIIGGVK